MHSLFRSVMGWVLPTGECDSCCTALRCCGDGLFVSPDVFQMTLLALRLHLVTWPVPAHSLITAVQTPTWPRCGAGFVVFWNQRAAEANAARSRCASIYGQLNMPVFDCEPRRSELRCPCSFQCYAGNKEKKPCIEDKYTKSKGLWHDSSFIKDNSRDFWMNAGSVED